MSRPTISVRAIPAVEKVLQALGAVDLPRAVVLAEVRRELNRLRQRFTTDAVAPPAELAAEAGFEAIVERVRTSLGNLLRARLQPVINGTGILIHTNLGRAPLSAAAVTALAAVAANYSNLEFDLTAGERGGRAGYLEFLLAHLCGADAATVVNNCAAALVLILRHLTAGERKEVVISRGELIQIGGGFRIPEILESSGARLREVGTTNRTTLEDYSRAMGPGTALLLRVHRSNFFMRGFVESAGTEALADLARRRRVPLVEDLGSGAVLDLAAAGLTEREPTAAGVLKRGVDLVCFSGDKLLGGPQAGIIAGRARRIAALKREPFYRALRCDKLVLAALQATVEEHLRSGARALRLPLFEQLRRPEADLRARAETLVAGLADLAIQARVGQGKSQVGGGTLPAATIPSVTIELRPRAIVVDELAARLRRQSPAVIGYVAAGRLTLDLRTIFPEQDAQVLRALRSALG